MVPGIAISAIALCIVQRVMLGMPVWITIAAIVLSVPLMLVGLRVLGETNWGPISALSEHDAGRVRGARAGQRRREHGGERHDGHDRHVVRDDHPGLQVRRELVGTKPG